MELLEFIDSAAQELVDTWNKDSNPCLSELQKSIAYSFTKGGKRFRPMLALMIADAYAVGPKRILPWALAVEMIHTYSLIHDDLPCMDNDDFRRGAPTNHKIFGETTALLAGDGLLTEAFHHLAKSYQNEPELGLKLVALLGEASGMRGMVGGQAIDISFQKKPAMLAELEKMHLMKTGALIRVAAEGAALACGIDAGKISLWRQFGEKLGIAFQIKDDILDAQEKVELGSFPGILGIEETKKYFQKIHAELNELVQTLGFQDTRVSELVEFNFTREK